MAIDLEKGLAEIEKRAAEFPMTNRPLGEMLHTNFMTVYRHARKLGMAPYPRGIQGYDIEQAKRILQSICEPRKMPLHYMKLVSLTVRLEPQYFDQLRELASQEKLLPDHLLYRIIRSYLHESKK